LGAASCSAKSVYLARTTKLIIIAISRIVPINPMINPKIALPIPCFLDGVVLLLRMLWIAIIEIIRAMGLGIIRNENSPR
jgi:hypothetical protein